MKCSFYIHVLTSISRLLCNPRGHSTLGYAPCATKKTLLFSFAFTERPPFLPTFTQWPLYLTNSLSPKDPDTSLSLKDPSFSHLKVKQVTIFSRKKKRFFRKFRQIWRNVEKFLAIFYAIHRQTPIFVRFVTERPPFLTQFVTERPLHLRCLVALVRHHGCLSPCYSAHY